MVRWLKRLAVVAAIVAVGIALRLTVFRPPPVPVTLQRVGRGTVEETVSNSKAGTVTARRRAKISPAIGGQVEFIGPREGAPVHAGDVLLRINDRDLRANLTLARQEVISADATAREACFTATQASRDLDRNEKLRDDRIVSDDILERLRSQRDAAAARCEAARAATERARAAVSLADANLDKTILRAPFDGIVADLKAELGEWVSPSPPALPIPPVYDIIDPTSIYVSAPIDEVDAGRVARGQPARVTLDPFPGKSFTATVVRVAPYVLDIEQQNRTLEIEVEFEDAAFSRTLLPGTSADVEVILKAAEGVLRIPSYALMEGDRVLVLDGGRLHTREVEVGLRNWEYAEVSGGLSEKEAVVVSLDRAEVKEGARAVEAKAPGKGADGKGAGGKGSDRKTAVAKPAAGQ
jgi:HlyD family secretion protein